MEETAGRAPSWGFVDGSISVSASMLVAVLINKCHSCSGIWILEFLKELSDKNAGMIVLATLLLFPTSLFIFGGTNLFFAAKDAFERRQRKALEAARKVARQEGLQEGLQEGRLEGQTVERERISQTINQTLEQRGISLTAEEISKILEGEPAPRA
jgi:hypothetical protein